MRKIIIPIMVILIANGIFAGETTDTLFLTLEKAKELALKRNESILSAKEKLKEVEASIGIARAGFLPSVSFQGSYTRLAEIPAFGFPEIGLEMEQISVLGPDGLPTGDYVLVPMTIPTGDTTWYKMGKNENYLLRASIQQSLFTWGTLINSYRIADISLKAEKENYRKRENDIILQVAQGFLGAILLRQTVNLMEESYQQMERHANQVKTLYNNGMVQKLDLLRAEVELSNLYTQVMKIRNQAEIALSTLKMLLVLPEDLEIVFEDELEYEPYEIELEEAVNIALKNRPDLISMRFTKEITEKALAIERAQNKPKLALVYNYDYKKPVTMMENEWGTDWNVTLALSMPIFQGGSHISKVNQRKAELKQIEYGLSQFEDAVRLDVKTCWLVLGQERDILSYQKKNVSRAEEALRLAEQGYKNGMITNLEYMDTHLALTGTRLELLFALVNYNIAIEKLLLAMGRDVELVE